MIFGQRLFTHYVNRLVNPSAYHVAIALFAPYGLQYSNNNWVTGSTHTVQQ